MQKIAIIASVFLILTLPVFAQDISVVDQLEYFPPAQDNGELVIDFENDESVPEITGRLSALGVKTGEFQLFSQEEKWVRIRGLASSLLERLKSDGDIEIIEPNYYFSALFVPNDPYYKYQWHLDQIGMQKAWTYPAGAPVTVAVIDTGIAYEKHGSSFLVEDLGDSQFVKPYNFVSGNEHANDDHGHGTHVAGTIAQLTNNSVGVAGVASNSVRLMPLKVLSSSGYGTMSSIAAAIRYAADNGASVINMSLGGPFPSRILHKAIQYAHSKGVVIVCAAGNSSRSGLSYPAAYSECISVSAVRYDGTLSWYSSYGKGLTIAAPGGDTRVDQNGDGLMDGVLQNTLNPQDRTAQGYFLFQGTSMAAPHVAAVAALLVSHGVTDPERVREYLQKTATKVPGGSEQKYGAGIVSASTALKSILFWRKAKLAAFAFVLLVAILAGLNRDRASVEKVRLNGLALLGLLLGATGLFFLGFLPYGGSSFFVTHSAQEWILGVFGPAAFANALVFSFLPAMLLALVLYPWKRMTPFTVAFCVSIAAFLLYQAFFPTSEIRWIPGRLLEFTWLFVNALISLLIALSSSFRLK